MRTSFNRILSVQGERVPNAVSTDAMDVVVCCPFCGESHHHRVPRGSEGEYRLAHCKRGGVRPCCLVQLELPARNNLRAENPKGA